MTAPTLTSLLGNVTFAENLVNATLQLLDPSVVFGDAEGNFLGGSLTVSGLLAEDRVTVRNEGSGVGQIGLIGSLVTYSGAPIGTMSGGAGGTLTISLGLGASVAAIDALIRNLTYANISNTPTALRTLQVTVTDVAGETTGPLDLAVTVTAGSETPGLTGFGPAITFAENLVNAAPQLLDGFVNLSTAGSLSGGRLTVSGLLSEDRVSVRNQGTGAGQIGRSGADDHLQCLGHRRSHRRTDPEPDLCQHQQHPHP